jgi:hypothetical protein
LIKDIIAVVFFANLASAGEYTEIELFAIAIRLPAQPSDAVFAAKFPLNKMAVRARCYFQERSAKS